MTKLTKRTVDAADIRERDYFIWDDELPAAACAGLLPASVAT